MLIENEIRDGSKVKRFVCKSKHRKKEARRVNEEGKRASLANVFV